MGLGDSIGKAAENAMEDLAGTSTPQEEASQKQDNQPGNAGIPDPADPNDDVEVHSSLSEGSNAMDKERLQEGEPDTSAPGSLHNSDE